MPFFCAAWTIEKRFSQLKTDFEVAPVYLKSVHRIEALLCVYFFALLAEALMERQLRQAMQRKEIEALPIYPEGRSCRWPTARWLAESGIQGSDVWFFGSQSLRGLSSSASINPHDLDTPFSDFQGKSHSDT
jgi:hypothetical protein